MEERRAKGLLLIILFLIFISTHMQFPVFTPLAISLGATSFVVGVVLSTTSFVNLTGNIFAGSYIDHFGVKWFIVIPLFFLSVSLYAHTLIEDTFQLFLLRVVNGFILAFLTPACMTLLASFAKTSQEQSKNMALNTFMVTLAMTIAPIVGGLLGEKFGATDAYYIISFTSALAFLLSIFFLQLPSEQRASKGKEKGILHLFRYPPLLPVFLTGFGIMFAQGTLMYELPFLSVEQGFTKGEVGKMASFIGIGTFFVLSLTFLHRISARTRVLSGLMIMALALFSLLLTEGIPSFPSLFLFGIASGIIFPAMMTLVTENINESNRGKAFAFLSAVFSIGTISAPFIAGSIRTIISPYYVAWVALMIIITFIGLLFFSSPKRETMLLSNHRF